MNLLDLKQGFAEWLQERIGRCTGSRVKDALAVRKDKQPAAPRTNYLIAVVTERLKGDAVEHFVTQAMEWGIATEKYARAAYEIRTGNEVDRVGISAHATIDDFMASPDGFVGDDGVVEFKCPNSTTHVAWMIADAIPEEHRYQLLAELSCSGRQWVDFVSFDPRLPPRMEMFIKRLERTYEVEVEISDMEEGVNLFLSDVQLCIAKLYEMNPDLGVTAERMVTLPYDVTGGIDLSRLADELAGQILQ